jgi:hypothetical protein
MHPHHYRLLVGWIIGILIGSVVAGAAFWAYEYFWARFKPTLLTKDASEIQRLLDQGDWVSPGRKGAALYIVTYRDCDACQAYQRQEFPKLAAVDVDTRVLAFVRPDVSGQSQSTPSERSTVAELWINRDWGLYDRWTSTSEEAWAPQGLRSADGDWARSAVVTATHAYVDRLTALLHENGLTGQDPILIWRDKRGQLKACACADPLSYHFVRSDFGAPDKAPPQPAPAPTPAPATAAVSGAPAASSTPPAGSSAPAASPSPAPAASGSQPAQAPAQPAASSAPATSGGAPDETKMNNKPPAHALSRANSTFY